MKIYLYHIPKLSVLHESLNNVTVLLKFVHAVRQCLDKV